MQFSCESCKTQLQIADEKVRGKRLIVRCKRCGAKISISDPALGAARPRLGAGPPAFAPPAASASSAVSRRRPVSAQPSQPASAAPAERDSDTDSTRAMDSHLLEQALQASKSDEPTLNDAAPSAAKPPPSRPAPESAGAPLWFAMLHGKQTGPLTRAELGARTDEGAIGPRTYLWKDGMNAWQRAKDLPELQGLFRQLPEAPSLPPPAAPPPSGALREFSSADFVAKAQPVEAIKPEQAKDGPAAAAPFPFGDLVNPEGIGNELFAPEQGSVQKPGGLAKWAAAELEKKSSPPRPSATPASPRPSATPASTRPSATPASTRPSATPAPPRPSATPASTRPGAMPAPRMFEGSVQSRSRGPFVLVVLGIAAAAAVGLWLTFESGSHGAPPAPKEAEAKAAPGTPVKTVPAKDDKPPAKPEPKSEPPASTGLTADQVRKKLDENKGALQGCIDEALRRDPNLRVGKIHIATTIAPTGAVTQARVDKSSVDQSPLGACLRRATKKIAFPSFRGDAFDVDIPIVVTAGE